MSKNFTRFVKVITVEPAYFLYWTVYVIIDATNTNLMLQKKCRFSTVSEPDLNTPCDDEKQGVLFANEMNSYYRFAMLFFCEIYAMFATSWSDDAGRRRRPLIVLPIIGLIFQAALGCLNSYFWSWIPLTVMLSFMMAEMATGGITVMIVATQMYICDVSSMESRTMRVGILLVVRTMADLIGCGSSGYILRSIGFYHTYLLCFILSIVSLVLALIFVKDTSVPVEKKLNFVEIFRVSKISNAFRIVFDRNVRKRRIIVFALLTIYILVFFTTQGEKGILYLFLRYKFHWDEREFSFYVFYRYIGVIVGSLFCSIILSKFLSVHDGLIGTLAGIFDTVAALGYLFANQNWHLYVVPLFDIFHGTALSVSISFMSKYYQTEELGRLNSVLIFFALITTSCHPIYNGIFKNTLDIFPAAFFLLSIALDIIIVMLYCYVYLISRKFEIQKPCIKKEEQQMIDQNE